MGKYFQEEIETASREKIEQIQKKNGRKRCNT